MTLRALIFDFDGLILDTETSEYETVRELYEDHGVALELESWLNKIGTHTPHWLDELEEVIGPIADRGTVLEQRRLRHNERVLAEAVLPGVTELIDEARRRGLRLGVASSSSHAWVGGHLERLGLLDRFGCVSCRTEDLPPKPAPDVYEAACRDLGVEPTDAVAFEDSAHGVRAAKAAGLWCVAVPGAMTRSMRFDEADLVVASLADLTLDHLDRLTSRTRS